MSVKRRSGLFERPDRRCLWKSLPGFAEMSGMVRPAGGGSARSFLLLPSDVFWGERNFAVLFEKFSVAETKAGP